MSFGKDKLHFDSTDADTLASSDLVGAVVRTASGVNITATSTSLDVNITNASVVVSATNLDIRDLVAASDSVASWLNDGSGNPITSSSSALDVNIQSSDIALTVSDIANTAIESTSKSVTSTTGAILGSQLANRKFFYYQNLGLSAIYIGKSGVTTANGFRMSGGSMIELRLGASLSLHAVGVTVGGVDTRVMELS